MSRFRKFICGSSAAVMTASMVFSSSVSAADPMEELNEILEAQMENSSVSLLEETLGLEELGEAIGEKGLQFQMKAGVTEGTARLLDLGEDFPEEGYVTANFQLDKQLKKWLFETGAGMDGSDVLNLFLYGDEQQLALSIPQFYSKVVTISAGNLKEMFESSALAQIFEDVEMPDLDMTFYPSDELLELGSGMAAGMKERLEEQAEALQDKLELEKTEDGDVTVYTAVCRTSDLMEIYKVIFDEYFNLIRQIGTLAGEDMAELSGLTDTMIDQMSSILGDQVTVEFEVSDNLVEKISYHIFCDTTVLAESEEMMTEIVEETLEPAGDAENASDPAADEADADLEAETAVATASAEEESADEDSVAVIGGVDGPTSVFIAGKVGDVVDEDLDEAFTMTTDEPMQAYLDYSVTFADPEDLSRGMDFEMTVTDLEGQELAAMTMNYTSEINDTVETVNMFMSLTEEGETVYTGTPFTMTFDAATGDLDAAFEVTEDDTTVRLVLDSTFTQIEKGKSFTWQIHKLGAEAEGESVEGTEGFGVLAEISVSADPGDVAVPGENVQQAGLFDMTTGELMGAVQEIGTNITAWEEQYAVNEDAYDSSGDYEVSEDADDSSADYDFETEVGDEIYETEVTIS